MLKTLVRFLDPWEAYVVQARLQAEDIPATVAFANHAIVNWPMSLALGGTAVQVPESFMAQAQALLSEYRNGALEEALNEETGSQKEHCPRCGSMDFKRTMPWFSRLCAACIVLIVAAYPARRSLLICRNCDCRWSWGEH